MRDILLAFRSARRRPLLAGIIVLTLALGISLTTVVFSIADRVLFRQLPYRGAERLMAFSTTLVDRPDDHSPLTAAGFMRLRSDLASVTSLAAYRGASLVIGGPDGPRAVQGSVVTPNAFEVVGLPPLMGPGFTPGDPSRPPLAEVVLSHELWQSAFNGEQNIVGRSITVGGEPHTVVGVMPAATDFPATTTEIWTPVNLVPFLENEERAHRQRFFNAIGRMAPGASAAQVHRELAVIAGRLATELPHYHANERLGARSLREQVVGHARPRVRLLLGAGLLLLAIACANAASVLWAQVITRRAEFAVRAALGAGRARLARQLTVEGLVLAAIGGALGLALAPLLAATLRPMTSPFLPPVGLPVIDARVLGVAGVACLVCGLLLGLFPALLVARGATADALRSQGRSSGGGRDDSRVRGLLLVVQTSMCVALLVSAGLLIKSLVRLQHTNIGFDTTNVLTFQLSPTRNRYATDEALNQLYNTITTELRALPGVTHVASVSAIHMVGGTWAGIGIQGRETPPGQQPQSGYFSVDDDYFALLRIPLRRGRLMNPKSTEGEVVINETMAREFWPNGDAIGTRLHIGPVQTGPWTTVVGVVADIMDNGANDSLRSVAYGSHREFPWTARGILMRTTGDASSHAAAVRRVVARVDPSLPVMRLRTFDSIRHDDVQRERMSAVLLALFASGALVLALVGIYGLTAALVAGRTREFGIRIALGAMGTDVLREAMGRGIMLTGLGLAIGLAISAMISRLFASLIHGVRPFDVAVYAGVSGALGLTALLATWVPARRATRIDPASALRSD